MTWFMIIDVSTVEWKFSLGFPEWENYKFGLTLCTATHLLQNLVIKIPLNVLQWSCSYYLRHATVINPAKH